MDLMEEYTQLVNNRSGEADMLRQKNCSIFSASKPAGAWNHIPMKRNIITSRI